MDEPGFEVGLTTKEALFKLHNILNEELVKHETYLEKQNCRLFFSTLKSGNVYSCFHNVSIIQLFIFAFLLFTAYIIQNGNSQEHAVDSWWLVEAILLLVVCITNVTIVGWINLQRNGEYVHLLRKVLNSILECAYCNTWNSSNYPQIYSPLSPCISLQWTFRDGEVVNLPTCLLVAGDVILLRPGHQVPVKCRSLEESIQCQYYYAGEVFTPDQQNLSGHFSGLNPQNRVPNIPEKFVIEETPYLQTMITLLEHQSLRQPSLQDKERHVIASQWIERKLFFIVILLVTLCNGLRYFYVGPRIGHWTTVLLVIPVHTCLPLLAVTFPFMWISVSCYNQARLLAAFDKLKNVKPAGMVESCYNEEIFQTNEVEWVYGTRLEVWKYFKQLLLSDVPGVVKMVDIFHTLGSIRSFVCVDKKGILSWPNPSAEKVFFLNSHPESHKKEDSAVKESVENCTNFEVLGVTHTPKSPNGVQFDDPDWQTYVSSLKPIGLSILLNTCHLDTVEWYTQFTDHVASSASRNEDIVAVVNKRCLCDLADLIGFTETAIDVFTLNNILGVYRQVSANESAREKQHRENLAVEHKIPMPNSVSTIAREKYTGIYQMISQGTADIIVDSCTEFWDGQNLHPLSRTDRKKILDYYRRATMSAYCTTFSYRPLLQNIESVDDQTYLELPPNTKSRSLYGEEKSYVSEGKSSRALSVDLGLLDTFRSTNSSKRDLNDVHSNHIFIGMVAMQYQAREEVVQLIDQLDMACIRFVHFSEENELRSRVFSEKMGLEAGWNCHISLKSRQATDDEEFTPANSFGVGDTGRHVSNASDLISFDVEVAPKIITSHQFYSSPDILYNEIPDSLKLADDSTRDAEAGTTNQSAFKSDDEEVNERSALLSGDDVDANDEDLPPISPDNASSFLTLQTSDSRADVLDNRANLPRGIDNIRPHLANVDNVPLLVNLFTDCTPESSKEMIKIMQESEQVVLCLGSSLNFNNTSLFLQSDIGVAIEPLYPRICARYDTTVSLWNDSALTPNELAGMLISLPCSLFIKQDENINFFQLIAQARSLLMASRSVFLLMLHCHLSLTFSLLFSSFLQFYPIISSRHMLWLLIVVIPATSLSVINVEFDPRVLIWTIGNEGLHLSRNIFKEFGVFCASRIMVCIVLPLITFGYQSYLSCVELSPNSTHCNPYAGLFRNGTWNSWLAINENSQSCAQNIFLFQMTLNFVSASMSSLYRHDQIFTKIPFRNVLWCAISTGIIIMQLIYCIIDVVATSDVAVFTYEIYILTALSPVVVVVVNEIIKHKEIKHWVRYQKRCRLNFGTKLGMNSPF